MKTSITNTFIRYVKMKKKIINEIKEILTTKFNVDGYYPFLNAFTFVHDYSKYDFMAMCLDEDDNLLIECIGYNSFKLNYINTTHVSNKTLYKIKNYIETI